MRAHADKDAKIKRRKALWTLTCPGNSQDLIVTVVSLTLSPRNSKSCVSVIMEF